MRESSVNWPKIEALKDKAARCAGINPDRINIVRDFDYNVGAMAAPPKYPGGQGLIMLNIRLLEKRDLNYAIAHEMVHMLPEFPSTGMLNHAEGHQEKTREIMRCMRKKR